MRLLGFGKVFRSKKVGAGTYTFFVAPVPAPQQVQLKARAKMLGSSAKGSTALVANFSDNALTIRGLENVTLDI